MNIKPNNRLELWIDNHYNDQFMKMVYANATFADLSKLKKRVKN